METLDLRTAPPRGPRETLAEVIFLPRTIDKVRALLPGGEPGDYKMSGFSEMLLERLGIPEDDFRVAVRDAAGDDDVAAFVTARTTPELVAAWNAFAEQRPSGGGDRARAERNYPWLVDHPEMTLVLDVLAEDDRRAFAR